MPTPVAAGVTSAPLSGAGTLQFADRYGYVNVENPAATVLYASADPSVTTPTASTNNTVMVPANGNALLANRNPLWFQSSKVIQQGTLHFGGGNTVSQPSSPGHVTMMESLAGQMANPGTTVSVSGACMVSAAG